MLEAIFNFVINIFFWICSVVGTLVIYPIQALIVTLFPTIGTFLAQTLTFFVGSIFPMLSFAKEAILDITCMPRPVFSVMITYMLAKWAIAPAIRTIIFGINIWNLTHGGLTISYAHGVKEVKY